MNAYSLAMSNNKSDWYISTEVPNSYNSKVYKNGKEIAHLDSQFFSLLAVGNDWYAGTQTDLVEGKIYKNGQEIAKLPFPVISLAVNGNDWYAASDHKIYKNGQEIANLWAPFDLYVCEIGSLVINDNYLFAANTNSNNKVYKIKIS